MKKTYLLIAVLMSCIILVFWLYHDSTFVKDNFKQYTNISQFIVEAEYHDNSQSFIKAIIPSYDRARLLKQYKFGPGTEDLKGKVPCPFIRYDAAGYEYSVKEQADSQYGYTLLCLKKDDNTLILYEYYGD